MKSKLSFSESLGAQFTLLNATMLNSRILWSIRWRWVANAGFFLLILLARSVDILLDYESVWLTLMVLAVSNLIYQAIYIFKKNYSLIGELSFISVHMLMDVLILTWLIHLTGGVENPLYFFYIFHVIISSIIFPKNWPYLFTTFVFLLFNVLVWAEFYHFIGHNCLYEARYHQNLYLNILSVAVFTTAVFLTTHICTSFMKLFRQSQREVKQLNRLLMEKESEKSSFYRYTSHELKAPVVSIKTSIDAVLASSGNGLPDQARRLLKRASARAAQMLDMLKELLELSWEQSKGKQTTTDYVDVREVLLQSVEMERAVADSRGIRFYTDFEKGVPGITADKNSLQKLFGNIVGNAVRYNRDGGTIHIRAEKKENGVSVTVQDEGIGIAGDDLRKIFDPFYRSAAAKEFTDGGSGLGLSLVKQIVDNLGGRIEVDSAPGHGTTFTIFLPAESNS